MNCPAGQADRFSGASGQGSAALTGRAGERASGRAGERASEWCYRASGAAGR
ncbi:hypothetical protein [Streptomyces microflavus]|uniref:hypothetical protein n=1 Tax=Streptomyces microflavus TaxID=1919 RepID=UPI00380C1F11